jgi:DNA polymerase III epsilon subunit-like protein
VIVREGIQSITAKAGGEEDLLVRRVLSRTRLSCQTAGADRRDRLKSSTPSIRAKEFALIHWDWIFMRQIGFNTETTGLSADSGDRIIRNRLRCCWAANSPANNKHYLNPERGSHEDAMKVHDIIMNFERQRKPKFKAVAAELLELQGAEVDHPNACAIRRMNKAGA